MTTIDQPADELGPAPDPATLVPLEERCAWRRDELGDMQKTVA